MFVGKLSDELRERIMSEISCFNDFIDSVVERNGLELGDKKDEFIKETNKIARDNITSFFEWDFFDTLENDMISLYEDKYEKKENK